ncbi:hypothetical protein D9M68_744760 [compost metagenome]
MRVFAGEQMKIGHVAGTFLDGHDVSGFADSGEILIPHHYPHAGRIVVEHDREIGRPVHRQSVDRVLLLCRQCVGRR